MSEFEMANIELYIELNSEPLIFFEECTSPTSTYSPEAPIPSLCAELILMTWHHLVLKLAQNILANMSLSLAHLQSVVVIGVILNW